jgi:hypothetical protein
MKGTSYQKLTKQSFKNHQQQAASIQLTKFAKNAAKNGRNTNDFGSNSNC